MFQRPPKDDPKDEPLRGLMRRVYRLGPPATITPDGALVNITHEAVHTIDDPQVLAMFERQQAQGFPPSIVCDDPRIGQHPEQHGSKAIVLWLDRGVYDPTPGVTRQMPDDGGVAMQELAEPALARLSEKYGLPLTAYPFSHHALINEANPIPSALVVATDKAHEDILQKQVVSELQHQNKYARSSPDRSLN